MDGIIDTLGGALILIVGVSVVGFVLQTGTVSPDLQPATETFLSRYSAAVALAAPAGLGIIGFMIFRLRSAGR